jgi:hypothetical protein
MSKPPFSSIAEYHGNNNSGDTLIDTTDQALFLVMRRGCNQVARIHAGQV